MPTFAVPFMSAQGEPLMVHLMIYAEPTLSPHESHVLLAVQVANPRKFYVFHAVEDTTTESEMKFEVLEKERDPLGTNTKHQTIALQTHIRPDQFDSLSAVLAAIPVPRPKPSNWNCQSWLYSALVVMEQANFLPTGYSKPYYDQMMQIINTTSIGAYP